MGPGRPEIKAWEKARRAGREYARIQVRLAALETLNAMSEDDPKQPASAEEGIPPPPPPAEIPEANPAQRGDEAAKAILLRLLETIEANELGVLLNEDPECLHDFRIAVRRTRSALGQIKGIFPERTLSRFAPRFAWLGQITSKPRDLDVYLLGFDELKNSLPKPYQADIEPLRGFLEHHADLAHADLARQIHSQRYRALLADWRKFLLSPCPRRPTAPNALSPIKDIANTRIWKLFRRVLKQGQAIAPQTPAESIHELRKTCKKLRYLLEFFRTFHPPDEINRPIKHLKKFQDYLGEFQDVHARIGMLQGISHEMRKDQTVSTDTLLALGVLLATLDRQQVKLRKEFTEHYEPFAHHRNRERFRELFKPVETAPLTILATLN